MSLPQDEPCGACDSAAWMKWAEKVCMVTGSMPTTLPRICDNCRERLGRIAAQYQEKEKS